VWVISQGDNEEEGLGISKAQLIPKKVASSLSVEVVTLGDGGKPEEKVGETAQAIKTSGGKEKEKAFHRS